MNELDLIDDLLQTKEYSKLKQIAAEQDKIHKEFDALSLFDHVFKETAWSRLFAFLLDSQEQHFLGKDLFCDWLSVGAKEVSEGEFDHIADVIKKISRNDVAITVAETEWPTGQNRFIDIVVRVFDKSDALIAVIAIENKVGSGDQPNQVRDYQRALVSRYKEVPVKVLVYLTPDGRPSTTYEQNQDCPYVPFPYSTVSKACNRSKRKEGNVGNFLSMLENHINKLTKTMNMEDQIRKHIETLFIDENHHRALRYINRYMPNIDKVFEKVQDNLCKSGFVSDKKDFLTYYGDTTELKLHIEKERIGRDRDSILPVYMLVANVGKDEVDIHTNFTLRLMLHMINGDLKKRCRELSDKLWMSGRIGAKEEWNHWISIWTGKSLKLKDLADKDALALSKLLIAGIEKTQPELKRKMKWLRKQLEMAE